MFLALSRLFSRWKWVKPNPPDLSFRRVWIVHSRLYAKNHYFVPKTIGSRKWDRAHALGWNAQGDEHKLRKSADRKAQINPVSGTNALVICAAAICTFSQVVFITSSIATPRTIFFSMTWRKRVQWVQLMTLTMLQCCGSTRITWWHSYQL